MFPLGSVLFLAILLVIFQGYTYQKSPLLREFFLDLNNVAK